MSYEMSDLFIFDSATRQQSSERLTPHKLTIMALVYQYQQLCALQDKMDQPNSDPEHVFTEKEKRVFMVTLLDILQSPDMDLKTLRLQIDHVLKPTILESVYNLLRTISKAGVMPINDFFDNVSTLLTTSEKDGVIRRESIMGLNRVEIEGVKVEEVERFTYLGSIVDKGGGVENDIEQRFNKARTASIQLKRIWAAKNIKLGLYIRRMELAYNEMSFSQVVDIFNKVRLYYEAGFPEHKEHCENAPWRKSPAFAIFEPALSLSQLEDNSALHSFSKQNSFSKKQAEYFIAHQALMLTHHEGKALSPDQLQQKICDILSANPDLAEAHFLSYMNNLRVKEYCTALHNLYHYFDRKACASNEGSTNKKKGAAEEVAMRYAALNLASLQFRFGNKIECRAALKEAIRLAQESNDQICLQHALVWLNLLGENHAGVTQLERSVRKTIDLSLPNLTVLGLNWISKDLGMGTETPARVIYYFTQSNLINCMHSNYDMMSSGCIQRAAMWHFYGKRELCSLDSQIVLNLNTSIKGVYYNGQAVCIAMCNLAQHHADLGEYSAATEILNQAKLRFPQNTSHAELWGSCQQRIHFDRAIHNRRLNEAEQIMNSLWALDEPEARIRKPALLRDQGQVTQAFDCLDQLLTECDKEKSGYMADYRCRVLLEIGQLYIATGNHVTAVSYITDCIAHAQKHHLELYGALGVTYMSVIQLHMGLPKQGMQLMESQLTRILTNASAYDKARSLYVYAKCKVATAKTTCTTDASIKSEIVSALEIMSTVSSLFKIVEAHLREKDAYYYQTLLYNELGDVEDRNKCAHHFKTLDKLYPTLHSICLSVV